MEPLKLKNFILNKGQKYEGHIKASPDSNNWAAYLLIYFKLKL